MGRVSQVLDVGADPDRFLTALFRGRLLPGGALPWGKTGHDAGYANGMFATRELSLRGVYSVSDRSPGQSAPPPPASRLLAAVLAPQGAAG